MIIFQNDFILYKNIHKPLNMPLSNLNQEQKEAILCKSGYNLIIASAGTGKTSTIVGRISHLLNNGVKPNEILLLTFTNKAASEMVSRVSNIFSKQIAKEIMAGTFHSVSYKLLKELEINITLKQPNELKTLFKSIYENEFLWIEVMKQIHMMVDIYMTCTLYT